MRRSSIPGIYRAFKIEAYNADSTAVVIDVTNLFMEDNDDLTPFDPYSTFGYKPFSRTTSFQKSNSHLGDIKAFEDNVTVKSYLSYTTTVTYSNGPMIGKIEDKRAFTALVTRTLLLLPEKEMRPRIADPRMNIFVTGKARFSSNMNRGTLPVYYARHWRVEPKDVEAYKRGELVEPVKPIVFYLDTNLPEAWKPYAREGIEQWNDAFEKIGFKNVVQVRDYPTPEEDPEFDPDNLKYSCIRYARWRSRTPWAPRGTIPHGRDHHGVGDGVPRHRQTPEPLALPANRSRRPQRPHDEHPRLDHGQRPALRPLARGRTLPGLHAQHGFVGGHSRRFAPLAVVHAEIRHDLLDHGLRPLQPRGTARRLRARRQHDASPHGSLRRVRREVALHLPARRQDSRRGATLARQPRPLARRRPDLPLRQAADIQHARSTSLSEDLGDDHVRASEYGIRNLKYIMKHLNEWYGEDDNDLTAREAMYKYLLNQYLTYINHVYNVKGRHHDEQAQSRRPAPLLLVHRRRLPAPRTAVPDRPAPRPRLARRSRAAQKNCRCKATSRCAYNVFSWPASEADKGQLRPHDRPRPERLLAARTRRRRTERHLPAHLSGQEPHAARPGNQNSYVDMLLMITRLAPQKSSEKGIADDERGIGFAPQLDENGWNISTGNVYAEALGDGDMMSRMERQLEADLFGTSNTPEEVGGFGYFRSLTESLSPRDAMYYGRLIKVRDLLRQKRYTGDQETRNHYELLLHRIEGALQ